MRSWESPTLSFRVNQVVVTYVGGCAKSKTRGLVRRNHGIYTCCPYISGTYDPAPAELTSLVENKDYLIDASAQAMVKAYDPTGEHAKNPLAWPYHAAVRDLEGLPPRFLSASSIRFV